MLGRLHYSFNNRYLVTVNFRADGSSKFPDKPWGYFPSTALAWKISEESFMKDFNNLDLLKIRAGWGRVGNDNIGNGAFTLKVFDDGPTFVDYVFGKDQQLANGATVLTWVNNGGHWETQSNGVPAWTSACGKQTHRFCRLLPPQHKGYAYECHRSGSRGQPLLGNEQRRNSAQPRRGDHSRTPQPDW